MKVSNLDSLLEQEKQKFAEYKSKAEANKAELEKQIITLQSKLNETQSEAKTLKDRLESEEKLKEDYHK